MNDLEDLLRQGKRGVVLDTNLLLVLLVGLWDPRHIARFKRTASYGEDDFRLLAAIVGRASRLVTTPHILTEVCNLLESLNRQNGFKLFPLLAQLQAQEGARERWREASALMDAPHFPMLGIADASLIDASRKRHLVVTDDAQCYAAMAKAGGLAININHLRSAEWLS